MLIGLLTCTAHFASAQEIDSVQTEQNIELSAKAIITSDTMQTLTTESATLLDIQSVTDSIPKKKPGLLRRIINYYKGSNIDRTFVKKIDWSIAPGPNYSSDIGFGIGVLVAGLYRLDRTDSVTAPSNITLYGNITTEKFALARFGGDNLFKKNKYRISYSGAAVYFPGAFYGVGYNDGQSGYVQTIDNTMFKARISGCMLIFKHTYAGVSASLDYTGAKAQRSFPTSDAFETQLRPAYEAGQLTGDSKKLFEAYWNGHFIPDKATPFENYIAKTGEPADALNVGLGLFAQYDSRDNITNPYKGILFKIEAKYYPKALGNSLESFGKVTLQFDFYKKLWKGMILAYDFFSDFTFGQSSWHMYARLGGTDRMRGYYEGRYRDDNVVQTQVELRQKIYKRHGITGWVGFGNIWGNDAFKWKNTLYSFGCGYRFEFKNRMNIRLDYGWGVFGNRHFSWDNKRSSAFIFTASEAF